jgi:polyphosphate kinase
VHAAQAEDLLEMMTDEVRERRFAPFVRLEANESMDTDMLAILMREMKLVQVSVPLATLHREKSTQQGTHVAD